MDEVPGHGVEIIPLLEGCFSDNIFRIKDQLQKEELPAVEIEKVKTQNEETCKFVTFLEEPEEIEIIPEFILMHDDEADDSVDEAEEVVWEGHFFQDRDELSEDEDSKRRLYTCHVCNKTVASSYNLKRHMMIHTGEKPHSCDVCDKRFRECSDMKKHRRIHSQEKCLVCHGKPEITINSTTCDSCGSSDKRHQSRPVKRSVEPMLEAQVIDQNNRRVYVCSFCDRTFGSAHNLRRHIMIHTGEKPFRCEICGKHFRELSTLKKHLFTHCDVKPHKCVPCGREYSDLGGYQKHRRRFHSELRDDGSKKTLTCDTCDKTFVRSSNYTQHLRTSNCAAILKYT